MSETLILDGVKPKVSRCKRTEPFTLPDTVRLSRHSPTHAILQIRQATQLVSVNLTAKQCREIARAAVNLCADIERDKAGE